MQKKLDKESVLKATRKNVMLEDLKIFPYQKCRKIVRLKWQ